MNSNYLRLYIAKIDLDKKKINANIEGIISFRQISLRHCSRKNSFETLPQSGKRKDLTYGQIFTKMMMVYWSKFLSNLSNTTATENCVQRGIICTDPRWRRLFANESEKRRHWWINNQNSKMICQLVDPFTQHIVTIKIVWKEDSWNIP